MKIVNRLALTVVLLVTFTLPALAGETNNPPYEPPPPCNSTVQVCTQNTYTSGDGSPDIGLTADILASIVNLTLGLIG